MKLIKDDREARWIPLDQTTHKQVKVLAGIKYGYVEFDGTKEEQKLAARLGRPVPRHRAWVSMANLAEHGGV